ncbi:MAG: hypothetical protein LBL94_10705 [Prevotellaceae bacterium]|jgi:hypothetical protein|nr:hypothetical protein [Prevotellaceae bacterium]
MKNNNVLIYAAALALLAFAACSSEVKENNANGELISEEELEFSEIAIRFTKSGAKVEATLWVGKSTEVIRNINMPALVLEAGKPYGYSLTMLDGGMSGVLDETQCSYYCFCSN